MANGERFGTLLRTHQHGYDLNWLVAVILVTLRERVSYGYELLEWWRRSGSRR